MFKFTGSVPKDGLQFMYYSLTVLAAMHRVLIIDDDRFTQNVLTKCLFKHYETRTADDGPMGIKLAGTWAPDVILLDVEMPGQNGYEVCDQLKRDKNTQNIPVVFLSGKSSVRERMLGFEVGADDYLTKPCEPEFLNKKLAKITDFYKQKEKLAHTAKNAEATALEAMSTSFELGKAVRFVEQSYNVGSYAGLANAFLDITHDLGLKASLMFKCSDGYHFFCRRQNGVSPIEEDLMRTLHNNQRFTDFGCRTQINYPRVALLVKNMPLDDRARYGRIKDTLPFILGACDAKVRVLDAEYSLSNQNDHLSRSAEGIQQLLVEISKTVSKNQASVNQIMLDLTTELSMQMHKMGLEGDQEDYILKQLDVATQRLHEGARSVDSVEHALSTMVKLLQLLSAEQSRIISENLSSSREETVDYAADVELF